jgi:hypothetical protein
MIGKVRVNLLSDANLAILPRRLELFIYQVVKF